MGPLMSAIAGPVAGALVGGIGSLFGAKSAADTSERMYKHRYQWQVKDMKKAGLNPMLAFSQGAPVPNNPGVPDIGGSMSRGAAVGASVAAQKALLESQKKNLDADTDLKGTQSAANIANTRATLVNTGIVEPQLGYSAVNAERASEKLSMEVQKLGKEAEKLDLDIESGNQAMLYQREMQPLLVKAQQLINEAHRLGLSEKESDAMFFENMKGSPKFIQMILEFIKLGNRR